MQTESLINAGLVKSDLRRFWPLWLIYAIVLGLFIVAPMYTVMLAQTGAGGVGDYDAAYVGNLWYMARLACIPYAVVAAIVVATSLNGHLFKPVTATFYGALPLKRRTIFASSFTAGLIPLLGVPVLAFLAMLPLHASFPAQVFLRMPLEWLGVMVAVSFVMYALAVLACQLAGTWPVAVLLYAVLSFLAVCLEAAARLVVNSLVYGTTDWEYVFDWASAPFFLAVHGIVNGFGDFASVIWGYVLIYCVAAVLIVVLAGILNTRRPMESAGESVAYGQLRPILKYLAGISVALLFAGATCLYRWLSGAGEPGVPGGTGYACVIFAVMVVGGLLGLVFAEIVMRRSTRGVFSRSWKGALALALVSFVFVGCTLVNPLGIVNKVPDASKVATAQIIINGDEAVRCSDAKGIEAVRTLNERVLAYGGARSEGNRANESYANVGFVYELGNGKVYQRTYEVFYVMDDNGEVNTGTESVGLIEDTLTFANSPESKKSRLSRVLDTSKDNPYTYTIEYQFDVYGSTRLDIPANQKANFIEEGLAPDLLDGPAGNIPAPWEWQSYANNIDVLLEVTGPEDTYEMGVWLDTERTSNTIAWLKKNYPDIDEKVWEPVLEYTVS